MSEFSIAKFELYSDLSFVISRMEQLSGNVSVVDWMV